VIRCKERDSNGWCNSIPSCSLPVTFFIGHYLTCPTLFAAHFDFWAPVAFESLSSLTHFRSPCPQNAHNHHRNGHIPKRLLYFNKSLLFSYVLLYMDIIAWALLCVCIVFNWNAEFVTGLVIFSWRMTPGGLHYFHILGSPILRVEEWKIKPG
jgi:hypothetical protein